MKFDALLGRRLGRLLHQSDRNVGMGDHILRNGAEQDTGQAGVAAGAHHHKADAQFLGIVAHDLALATDADMDLGRDRRLLGEFDGRL